MSLWYLKVPIYSKLYDVKFIVPYIFYVMLF